MTCQYKTEGYCIILDERCKYDFQFCPMVRERMLERQELYGKRESNKLIKDLENLGADAGAFLGERK